MESLCINIQLMLVFFKVPLLVLRFFYYASMTFLMLSVILLYTLDDTTLYSECDQASDLWQQLELASELKPDLRETVDWDRTWLVDFYAGKA